MSKTARASLALLTLAALVGLVVYYVAFFLRERPRVVATATSTTSGERQVNLTLETVAAIGSAPNPDWVSYLIRDSAGQWQHSTIFRLPAHALVNVTIYQFDGASGLRNPFWARPRGVVGDTVTVDGNPLTVVKPDDASHTFAVPDLGVTVPLLGVPDDAKKPCETPAPCPMADDHHTITFSFHTGNAGRFRWQCFVPCAAGFYFGFGGPMQTIGYMDGFLDVV